MSTVDHHPWACPIRVIDLPTNDRDSMLTQVMLVGTPHDGQPLDVVNNLERDEYKVIKTFVETSILPRILQYAIETFGVVLEIDDWNGWVRNCSSGMGTELHDHSGAHVSAVYYLEGSWGDLMMHDPRGAVGRGYPDVVREKCFSLFNHTPSTGDLVIFPSYVYHYVQNHPPGLRIAIPIDVSFKTAT